MDEGAATHAGIERGISRNDAVVAAAEGDRELLQRALHKLRLATAPLELAKMASSFSSWLAGWPMRP